MTGTAANPAPPEVRSSSASKVVVGWIAGPPAATAASGPVFAATAAGSTGAPVSPATTDCRASLVARLVVGSGNAMINRPPPGRVTVPVAPAAVGRSRHCRLAAETAAASAEPMASTTGEVAIGSGLRPAVMAESVASSVARSVALSGNHKAGGWLGSPTQPPASAAAASGPGTVVTSVVTHADRATGAVASKAAAAASIDGA